MYSSWTALPDPAAQSDEGLVHGAQISELLALDCGAHDPPSDNTMEVVSIDPNLMRTPSEEEAPNEAVGAELTFDMDAIVAADTLPPLTETPRTSAPPRQGAAVAVARRSRGPMPGARQFRAAYAQTKEWMFQPREKRYDALASLIARSQAYSTSIKSRRRGPAPDKGCGHCSDDDEQTIPRRAPSRRRAANFVEQMLF